MSNFLDLLKERIIVFDGAMGTYLQSLNLSVDDWGGPNFENCSENLLYTRPDAIEKVHTSFLDVGCEGHAADAPVRRRSNDKANKMTRLKREA